MEDALAKGPDNIASKERLVFAKHKSGYIFPVWIQLKMVQSMQNGVQFVALMKVDKKMMSANIGFILINKDKKFQGLSSSCIKMLNLDLVRMRRMTLAGFDVNKVAPGLLDNDHFYNTKQGSP